MERVDRRFASGRRGGGLSIVLLSWGHRDGKPLSSSGSCLWTTSCEGHVSMVGYRWVSTALRGYPHVVHRVVHRMTELCAQCRVIHKLQFRAGVRRQFPGFSGCWKRRRASYPQAEVIHRTRGRVKFHTLWITGCPQPGRATSPRATTLRPPVRPPPGSTAHGRTDRTLARVLWVGPI